MVVSKVLQEGGGGGRGVSRINVTGMLVISFRGVNRRFWSHSGCLGREGTIFVHAGIALRCE